MMKGSAGHRRSLNALDASIGTVFLASRRHWRFWMRIRNRQNWEALPELQEVPELDEMPDWEGVSELRLGKHGNLVPGYNKLKPRSIGRKGLAWPILLFLNRARPSSLRSSGVCRSISSQATASYRVPYLMAHTSDNCQ